ncbi:hypothetical protein [Streptomyces sp. NPDC085665]|uniref:DUF7848 domain-containing protein n=1 Tax=Streptomyces sp. NPDC085665 TaxID=3365735 RepID=UPI0037D23CFC
MRKLFRYLNWTVSVDRDREQVHLFLCEGEEEDGTKCRADSGERPDFESARGWTFEHIRERQDHRSFAHMSYTAWHMVPGREPE